MCGRSKGGPFVIIGADDRILVSDTTIFPYSAVVRVEVDFNGDGIFDVAGSGAMIGANDVLTAGHLLWNPDYGFAKNIMVVPAEAGTFAPFGSALGQSGNPKGRPQGSRNKLSEEFLADVHASWQVWGRPATQSRHRLLQMR
jgi:V8-like Glu-specific endopeptidase